MIVNIIVSAAPKAGHEVRYWLAWKHRIMGQRLAKATPWWQFRKRLRRERIWFRAMDRIHLHGRDVIYDSLERPSSEAA